jgi:hypothetical protein
MLVRVDPPVQDIEDFAVRCGELGYGNNDSLHSMKYQWCKDVGGAWWAAYQNGNIVSIAGCHPFRDGYRFVFRGAQTVAHRRGLSRDHASSIPWCVLMPEQIAYCGGVAEMSTPAYITTNVSHDSSGKMNRTHRVLHHLSHRGTVDYVGDDTIYNTLQSVWRLNVGRYYETLV